MGGVAILSPAGPLCVPGFLIQENTRSWAVFSDQPALLDRIKAFKPVPTSKHDWMTAWIHKDFFTAEFVFIHHDAHQN